MNTTQENNNKLEEITPIEIKANILIEQEIPKLNKCNIDYTINCLDNISKY